MSGHLSIDELADAAAGSLGPGRRAPVEQHLAGCVVCREQAAALRQVSTRLAVEPAPKMPAAVADRLEAALRHESARRASGVTSPTDRPQREAQARRIKPSLGAFGTDLPRPSPRRWVGPALVAAAAATLVSFGGYVLSASAGLNEPPAVASAVHTQSLAPEARALEQSRDLDPHRFSQAWQCARQVTAGRIVGIASTTVDGGPALLVYTRSDGGAEVTVVTGCRRGSPAAGPSASLPR